MASYTDLQKKVDALVGKFGMTRTIELLHSLTTNSCFSKKGSQQFQLLSAFVISESILLLDLNEKEFFVSTDEDYKNARMICYHLLRKHTKMSYSRIGKAFEQRKRAVLYHTQRCDEIFTVPQFHKDFVRKYNALEEAVMQFLTKIQ